MISESEREPLVEREIQLEPRMIVYHVCFKGPDLAKRALRPPWARSDADIVTFGLHLSLEYGGATEIVNLR